MALPIALVSVLSVVAIGVAQDLLKDASSSLIKKGWNRLTASHHVPHDSDQKGIEAPRPGAGRSQGQESPKEQARERLATRLLLVGGQFDTLSHWLQSLSQLHAIEQVLTDIERLVQDNSQADLDVLGDAELGKSVISYYRGVRGTMKGVRDLAASYQKHRAVSDIAQRLRESLIAGQAGSAECAREAKMLAERIRPTMKQP